MLQAHQNSFKQCESSITELTNMRSDVIWGHTCVCYGSKLLCQRMRAIPTATGLLQCRETALSHLVQ